MATTRITPQSAHVNLVRALAALQPPRIIGQVDANDIEARCDHLRDMYSVFTRYLDEIVIDTTNHLSGNRAKVALILFDSISDPDWDVVAALERAGCRFDIRVAA
jgi:hypothetical protein